MQAGSPLPAYDMHASTDNSTCTFFDDDGCDEDSEVTESDRLGQRSGAMDWSEGEGPERGGRIAVRGGTAARRRGGTTARGRGGTAVRGGLLFTPPYSTLYVLLDLDLSRFLSYRSLRYVLCRLLYVL